MNKNPHYFMIGLFMLVGAALGIGAVIVLSTDTLNSPENYIETYLDESVQGIDVGTPFKFRGVKIGSVSDVAITSQEYDTQKLYVMIRIALDEIGFADETVTMREQVEKEIAKGLRLKLVPQGITGLSFVEADFYPEAVDQPLPIDWTPRSIYIPSTPALMTKVGRSISRLSAQLDSINIEKIGNDVETITGSLSISVGKIEQIAASAQEVADELFGDLQAAAGDLPNIASNLNAVVRSSQEVVDERGADVELVLQNLQLITEDIRELVRMIKRYPGVLLSEPPKQ